MNILDTIIGKKKIEVEERKKNMSISELENRSAFKKGAHSFREFLLRDDKNGIIAEFKRRSPSKGIFNDTATVQQVTSAYSHYGASAISVLTDKIFFGGTLEDLSIAIENELPVLRKDFIIDEYQVIESKAYGASVVLLIAACLSIKEVSRLALSAKNLGLSVLLEIHNEQELGHICDDIDVVGVNNRDLKTFTVDINRSIQLSNKIPADKLKISESGIDNVATIKLLHQHGYNGFLMGEQFMKDKDPGEAFRMFVNELNKN